MCGREAEKERGRERRGEGGRGGEEREREKCWYIFLNLKYFLTILCSWQKAKVSHTMKGSQTINKPVEHTWNE